MMARQQQQSDEQATNKNLLAASQQQEQPSVNDRSHASNVFKDRQQAAAADGESQRDTSKADTKACDARTGHAADGKSSIRLGPPGERIGSLCLANVDQAVLEAARPHLTGNPAADEDIIKFYEARAKLLHKLGR